LHEKEQLLSTTKRPETPAQPDVHAERAIKAMRRATEEVRNRVPDALAGRFNPQPKKAAE
jgi:hypothetical protein